MKAKIVFWYNFHFQQFSLYLRKKKFMDKHLIYRGSRIKYNIRGSGSTIVLVHGFLEDSTIWKNYTDCLELSNCVISVDLPGFGESQVISDTHTMSLMAQVINQILIAENISKCIITGHSMGGYVALSFAGLFEEKLSGIVLFHSHAASDDNETQKNRLRAIDFINKNHKSYISSFFHTLFSENNVQKFETEINQLKNASLKTSRTGIIAAIKGMLLRDDHCDLLKKINVPVMFIIGKNDSKIPLDKIMPQISLPRISEAIIIDNVGHMGFIEEEELTLRSIMDFASKYDK